MGGLGIPLSRVLFEDILLSLGAREPEGDTLLAYWCKGKRKGLPIFGLSPFLHTPISATANTVPPRCLAKAHRETGPQPQRDDSRKGVTQAHPTSVQLPSILWFGLVDWWFGGLEVWWLGGVSHSPTKGYLMCFLLLPKSRYERQGKCRRKFRRTLFNKALRKENILR